MFSHSIKFNFINKPGDSGSERIIFLTIRVLDYRFNYSTKISTQEKNFHSFIKAKAREEAQRGVKEGKFTKAQKQIKGDYILSGPNGDVNADAKNKELKQMYNVAVGFIFELNQLNPNPSKEEAKRFFDGKYKKITDSTFIDYLQLYIDTKRDVMANVLTIQKFVNLKNRLIQFQDYYKINLSFQNIAEYSEKFKIYLMQIHKNTDTTVDKNLKALKTFLLWVRDEGYTKVDFSKFKTNLKVKETSIVVLERYEIQSIIDVDLNDDPALERVRDLFVFQFYVGQRFSDIAAFEYSQTNQNFEYWKFESKKAKKKIDVPLLPQAKMVLRKYENTDYSPLPKFTNQHFNRSLKEVARRAGLTEEVQRVRYRGNEKIIDTLPKYNLISSHTARRSFITEALKSGLTHESVMKFSGHSRYEMLKKYIRLTDDAASQELTNKFLKY